MADPLDDDAGIRAGLVRISPRVRDLLRRYLIADQPDRDALASRLLAERTEGSIALADLIDTLTMYPDQRRRVVRLLGELEARGSVRDETLGCLARIRP